jgi:parallel beta-helix repeat protein
MTKLKVICFSGLVLLTIASATNQTNIQSASAQEVLTEIESTIYLPNDCDDYGDWSEEDRTCVLDQDLKKSIKIIQNNVTLDCDGHNIDGSSGANIGSGVKASYKSSISVIDCNISNFIHGISFVHSDNNNLINNNISNNVNGIVLKLCDSNTLTNNIINWNENIGIAHHYSSNSALSGNTISGSQYNFDLVGNNDAHFINYVDKTNLLDGKPIYYLLDVEDQTFDDSTNAGLFYCINCDNITVEDLTLTNSRNNLLFRNTHNSRIENVTVSGNNYGINLMYSANNIITNSNILNGSYGAYFYFSDYNIITNSNFTNNYYNGIYLRFSNGNTITSNYFSNNISGVYLDKSNGNAITGNSILDNSHYGISISSSNNNIISDNIIFNNYLEGIFIYSSSYPSLSFLNKIQRNTISGNNFIYSSSYPSLSFLNKIQRNTISGNNHGIHLKRTNSSIITDNTISNNKGGVGLYECSGNKVYHNNFIDNNYQAYSDLNNNFDNGYPDGGNYWSDYEGDDFFRGFFQNWFGSDDIGDTAYVLRFNDCQDNYPFMTENGWKEQSQPPKEVPLYTQVISPYPPRTEEDEWADEDYDQGLNYSCGSTIAKCGCALTSAVMILRYYDVINVNDLDVNPGTLNEWLKNNEGYNSANINWLKVAKYSEYEVKYDIKKSGNYEDNFALLDEYLNKDQPAIVRERLGIIPKN